MDFPHSHPCPDTVFHKQANEVQLLGKKLWIRDLRSSGNSGLWICWQRWCWSQVTSHKVTLLKHAAQHWPWLTLISGLCLSCSCLDQETCSQLCTSAPWRRQCTHTTQSQVRGREYFPPANWLFRVPLSLLLTPTSMGLGTHPPLCAFPVLCKPPLVREGIEASVQLDFQRNSSSEKYNPFLFGVVFSILNTSSFLTPHPHPPQGKTEHRSAKP